MQNAALICPPPVTTGDQDVGHFPQVEQALSSSDNLLDGKPFSTQDLGFGPFSPMYIKIALENPNWNSRGHINGSAEIVVHSVDVNVMPKTTPQGGVIPTVAIDDIDYTWFTPGGGGAISYCPFPN